MNPWIRKYAAADVPALCALWLENFDDTENFVKAFHAVLPEIGGCMVAELDGKIVGAAYALMGQQLNCPGEKTVQLGFLYGVSVDKNYRRHGVGAAVVSAAYRLSKELGAEITGILPARAPLYDWYGKVLGMEHILFRRAENVKAEKAEPCKVISSAEYNKKREALLGDKTHVRLTEASMAFGEMLMAEYGGGLYSVSGGVAAAYIDGGIALIRELILPEGKDMDAAAASVAYVVGAEEALAYKAAENGDRYILSDKPLPSGCVWNMSFD